MAKQSAGLLPYRMHAEKLEVFLVHPGGPFWAVKNLGSWTIPKGQPFSGEDPLAAAQREFHEETGFHAAAPFHTLGSICQSSGKVVHAWAFLGNFDPANLVSNLCQIEWPPRSGKMIEMPEIDRGVWFCTAQARDHILPAQQPFLERLEGHLKTLLQPTA